MQHLISQPPANSLVACDKEIVFKGPKAGDFEDGCHLVEHGESGINEHADSVIKWAGGSTFKNEQVNKSFLKAVHCLELDVDHAVEVPED